MKKQFISLLCIISLVLTTLIPASVMADSSSCLTLQSIVRSGEDAVFTVNIDTDVLSFDSARLVVAAYDKDGMTVEKASETVTDTETSKSVTLPHNEDAVTFKAMLLSSDNKLKPLTPALADDIVYAKTPLSPETEEYKDLLVSLNILEDTYAEDFSSGDSVTRGEFAYALIRALGITEEEVFYRNMDFCPDVDENHKYSGYINLAAESGIITFADNFEADNPITYKDAVAATVRALGYEILAKKDGFPLGYLQVASDYGITKNITSGQLLSWDNLIVLIKNAIETPLMKPTTVSSVSSQWQILDGKADKSYETLLLNRDVFVATGTITQLYGNKLDFRTAENSKCYTFKQNRSYAFLNNSAEADKYRYQLVDIYVEKAGPKYIVRKIFPAGYGETLTLNSNDVISYSSSDGTLEYLDSGIEKSAQTDFDIVDYNHIESYLTPEEILMSANVEIKLIENTGDSVYDCMVATEYVYDRISSVDSNLISLANCGNVHFDFDDEEIMTVFEDYNGNPLDISDFGAGDAVAVVADATRPARYEYYIKFIKLTENSFTGTVDAISEEDRITTVTIDGKDYYSYYLPVTVGTSYRFFPDLTGYIFDYDENTSPVPAYGDGKAEPKPGIDICAPYPSYTQAAKLLSDLGITSGFTHNDASREITRGEFAKVICNVLSAGSIADMFKEDNLFTDVKGSHPYAGEINCLAQKKIIKGISDTEYGSEEILTYADAVEATVKALGYTPLADICGGKSINYVNLFNNTKLSSGISPASNVNSGIFVRLIYNMLSTPMMEVYLVSDSETVWAVMNGKNAYSFVSPLTKMNIFIANAIIQNVNSVNSSVQITYEAPDGKFIENRSYIFENGSLNPTDFLYEDSVVYVSCPDGDSYRIASIISGEIGSSLSIMSDMISEYRDRSGRIQIYYYPEPENSPSTYSINFEADGTVILNGSVYNGDMDDILLESGIMLKFIENNGDNLFDALVANYYGHSFIDYTDVQTGEIALTNGEVATVDLSDENTNIILTDRYGNTLTPDDFEEGDFVAYTVDGSSFSGYDTFLKLIHMGESTVTDYIASTHLSGGTSYVTTLSGKTYKDSTLGEISVGEYYILYIGYLGDIVKAKASESELPPSKPSIPDRTGTVITVPEDSYTPYEGMAIVTKVYSSVNSAGADVTVIEYVMNEEEGQVILDGITECINSDSLNLAPGDVFMFAEDEKGIADWYIVLATIEDEESHSPIHRLTNEVDTEEEVRTLLGENTELVTGYILNEGYQATSKGEMITVNSHGDMYIITDSSYRYTFNDTGRNTVINVADFMADTDYAYPDDWNSNTVYASPVFLRIVNNSVSDIYGTTARVAQ